MTKSNELTTESINMSMPCEQEQNIKDIKLMIAGLSAEFRAMLHEMREVFVVDAQHKIKIEGLEKAQDVIFEKIRLLDAENEKSRREKIDPLIDWKNQMQGSMATFKIIPVACVIITTLVALYTVLIGAQ